jgi:integral membrane protein
MITIFKKIAFLEGISLLLLLFFAMPMKYLLDQKIYVEIIGMTHGILFIVYVLWAIFLKILHQWDFKLFIIIFLASIIPFGTFYVEKKYF